MELPEKLRIGPIDYTLEVCDMGDLGEFFIEKSLIKVKEGLEAQQMILAIFHEAAHAMLAEAGSDQYDNESVVSVVSAGFFAFLKDNPEMLKYFVDKM